jgi:ubiquinone/menaquinone biosynthesis C-methylase UbiE
VALRDADTWGERLPVPLAFLMSTDEDGKDLTRRVAMRFRDCALVLIRKVGRRILRFVGAHPQQIATDVVKANTKEAFDFFYNQKDFIAQRYLEPDRLALYELVAEYCAAILTLYDVGGTVHVVDIGCGTGHMLRALREKLVPKHDVELSGIDFSSVAIGTAKKLLPTADFSVQDIYENSLPSDFFDLVLSIETLEHLHRPIEAVRELLRVCKPGCSVVVTVPNGDKDTWDGHVNFWSLSQFRELLSSYGAVDIRLVQDDTVIVAALSKQPTEADCDGQQNDVSKTAFKSR